MGAFIVLVALMRPAVRFVLVDDGKNLIEMLFRVLSIIDQFIVEPQNLCAEQIGIALIVGGDMVIQPFLGLLDLCQNIRIKRVSNQFRQPAPRIDRDFRYLQQ